MHCPGVIQPVVGKALSPVLAYDWLDRLNHIEDANKVLGVDPLSSNFKAWADDRCRIPAEDEWDTGELRRRELALLARCLERRGLEEQAGMLVDPLLKLAASDEGTSNEWNLVFILRHLVEPGDNPPAIATARRLIVARAGQDVNRWHKFLPWAFHDNNSINELFDRVGKVDPSLDLPRRFDVVAAVAGMTPDSGALRVDWIRRLSDDSDSSPPPVHELPVLAAAAYDRMDRAAKLRLLEAWGKLHPDPSEWHAVQLRAEVDMWNQALPHCEKAFRSRENSVRDRIRLACCLRMLGRGKEVDALEAEALGFREGMEWWRHSFFVGNYYDSLGDASRAETWWRRALAVIRDDDCSGEDPSLMLERCAEATMHRGEWKQAASYYSTVAYTPKARISADLARALSLLPDHRESAIRNLRALHHEFAGSPLLGDEFFPALRRAGLQDLHDELFERTWSIITKAAKTYPTDMITANGAAWLSARGLRHLDQGSALNDRALQRTADDTWSMAVRAELALARNDRSGAVAVARQAFEHCDPKTIPFDLYEQYLQK